MKHAVYCGTRNIYDDMEAAAKSLIANSDVDTVHFLIEDGEFPRALPDIIEVKDVSGQEYFKADSANMGSKFSYMAMMRAALCEVFPTVDKMLSLDADTICYDDVSGIWDTPLGDCYFAAVREPDRSEKEQLLYVNAGVVLFNLAKLRDGKSSEVIKELNETRYAFVEQDVFSFLCQGSIVELDGDYNACNFTLHTGSPKIIHYAGRNDWRGLLPACQYRHMTWEDVLSKHEAHIDSRADV